jgi:tripeptide aminopeptidase
VAAENDCRSTRNGPVTVEIVPIGDRPAGNTSQSHELVQFAKAAINAKGFETRFDASSTDANIPMSMGIPAIKIGSGGTGAREHSLDEWIDVEPDASLRGMEAGLATLLAVAGLV